MTIEDKIKKAIRIECKFAEIEGVSSLLVCNDFRWDLDLWRHREDIVLGIKKLGYEATIEPIDRHQVFIITSKTIKP